MKKLGKLLTLSSIILLGISMIFAGTIEKGDTLLVGNHKPDGTLNGALDYYINGDTTDTGAQKHSVYQLYLDSTYFVQNQIDLDEEVAIVAYEPTVDKKPPVVRPGMKPDGSFPAALFMLYNSATFKNIWMTGITPDGTGNMSWCIVNIADSDGTSYTFEGCIIENPFTGWSTVQGTGSGRSTWKIIDCFVTNNGTPGIKWNGAVFCESGPGIPKDSVICRNSTFFNFGGYAADCEGHTLYGEFTNNTLINSWTQAFQFNRPVECYMNNNIFYNCYMASEDTSEAYGRAPSNDIHGLIHFFELDSVMRDSLFCNIKGYDPNGDGHFTEDERIYECKNNVYYWSDAVTDYWASNDTVLAQKLMSDYMENTFFNDDENYPNIVMSNNKNIDPQFNSTVTNPDSIAANLEEIWSGGDGAYYFHEPKENLTTFEWPIKEWVDLSYTADLTDEFGNPIGDPDWFNDEAITGINYKARKAENFTLHQNYPNPFNPVTSIKFTLRNRAKVKLSIYNILGEKVKTLVSEAKPGGTHIVRWNGTDAAGQQVSSGIYLYQLEARNKTMMKKMMLLK